MRGGSEALWWKKTRTFGLAVLAIGAALAIAANAWANAGPTVFDLPFGLFAGIVVVPLAIAAGAFAFAARQQRLDHDFDVAGD